MAMPVGAIIAAEKPTTARLAKIAAMGRRVPVRVADGPERRPAEIDSLSEVTMANSLRIQR
ncbi:MULTISPECIES: hypothetical protein [Microbacterium]|uniref:hypothetical protein n=1 Tax=Microbacterium TaxID=33882 RepID=UPI00217ECF62|nr:MULTISPECIES: hypothetical protein [Microbacterium]